MSLFEKYQAAVRGSGSRRPLWRCLQGGLRWTSDSHQGAKGLSKIRCHCFAQGGYTFLMPTVISNSMASSRSHEKFRSGVNVTTRMSCHCMGFSILTRNGPDLASFPLGRRTEQFPHSWRTIHPLTVYSW